MGLFRWAESKIRTFTIWDMAVFKVCMIAFVLMVAKLWPDVLTLNWYWYALGFAITYAWILARMLRKTEKSGEC